MSSACLCCDWHFESTDPYQIFEETVNHFITKHKVALAKLRNKMVKLMEAGEEKK